MTHRDSPVTDPGPPPVLVRARAGLLAGLAEGPSLAAHRERYGAVPEI